MKRVDLASNHDVIVPSYLFAYRQVHLPCGSLECFFRRIFSHIFALYDYVFSLTRNHFLVAADLDFLT